MLSTAKWLRRRSRDSQALSGPMWNKVSWDTGKGFHIYLYQIRTSSPWGRCTRQLHTSSISISALLSTKPDLRSQNRSRISSIFLVENLLRCHFEATKASVLFNHPYPVNIETCALFLPAVPQTLRKGWASSSGSCYTGWSCGPSSVQLLLISPLWSHPESWECTSCSVAAQPAE